MELSINAEYLFKRPYGLPLRTIPECYQMLREAGFHNVDQGFTATNPAENCLLCDDWRRQVEAIRCEADKTGLRIHQTHAPFRYGAYDRAFYADIMMRSFEASFMLGAETVVVHGDVYPVPEKQVVDFEEGLRQVTAFYAPVVEYAGRHGLTICFENLFDTTQTHRRFCSRIEELKAVIDFFNLPSAGVCWDMGHGRISYPDDQTPAMKIVGDRIRATHVQDNYFGKDLHLCPMTGKEDWFKMMKTLRDIGYPGYLTFEFVYGSLPDPIMQSMLVVYRQIGEELLRLYQEG